MTTSNRQAGGRVSSVTRRLEDALLDGTFPANSRLPSERELAERYAVSRNTVREAIQQLGARGLVHIRPRSGVFVSDQLRTGATASPWGQLITDSPARREDILEFRRVLEGATAYLAALRGTDDDLERIRSAMARLDQARRAGDHAGESRIDVELHEAIAKASGNSMFLHLHSSITKMMREHIIRNVDGMRELNKSVSEALSLQHRTICDAICARRPEEARTAMQTHIDYVRSRFDADGDH
ncbi:FadR family transcriptional regulator [Massilia sp. TW-1]|uniref:Pyruvate dehydrogenase complex repressor n=1 Tax=Telluria antibiotica TaxID=2717319 RepID=A0ABX0PBJ4_9BURK|nr:FadR family transcriptional regulator [Telluria antibiotica]